MRGIDSNPSRGVAGGDRVAEPVKRDRTRIGYALALITLGISYYVAAKLGLLLAVVGESVTPLWPPTGIALVALLLFGYRVWPAVAVAAFLVNWPISPSAPTAAWIAAGNTLAPIVAAALLRAVGFRPELDRTRDAVALVLLGALAAMSVSATIGTIALERSEAAPSITFASTWAVWWAGDAMGILAVAPFLLSWRSLRPTSPISWPRVVEALAVFGALVVTARLINVTSRPVWVAVFPLLVWIAWRYQQRGSGAAALLVIAAASRAAADDAGPFSGFDLAEKMVALQIFNAAVALTSFFLAAVVAERIAARRDLERSLHGLHGVAETLQRSLLPEELPVMPDISVAARYVPASDEAEVGGDWYDLILLPEGRIGVAIGDVAGHGVSSAAAMGQIRMALRAYALEGLGPAQLLERLNMLIVQLQVGTMVTLAYGILDLESGGLTLAKAGHPPPLMLSASKETSFIGGGLEPPLGVMHRSYRDETTASLRPGSTLVLYTDGLIERRGESLSEGTARLEAAAADAPEDLEDLADHLVGSLLGSGRSDDAAILAVRLEPLAGRPFAIRFSAEPARLAYTRNVLGRWLRQNGTHPDVVRDMVLACNEACTNAIQHAYDSREGPIEVEADIADRKIVLEVRDFGAWRSPTMGEDGDWGRGLRLIRALVDSVDVSTVASGTAVTMTRTIEPRVDDD